MVSTIENLVESLPPIYGLADRQLILRAYRVAEKAHASQKRMSGVPYVSHCLEVAKILADMRVPPEVIAAGLLHDTVEDTQITLNDLTRDFGGDIAKLVDGVTKLSTLPRVSRDDQLSTSSDADGAAAIGGAGSGDQDSEEDEAMRLQRSRRYDAVSETLRKTLMAMGEDVRVVLIKLADRLHNMRTLDSMPEHKRRRIAQETLDIFAPLANRLGIWQMKWELEDLGFKYTHPEKYHEIASTLDQMRKSREQEMEKIKQRLESVLERSGVQAEISVRPKHIYSIYKKMTRKGVPMDMVYDVRGVRVLVPDVPACYATMGYIHSNWRPIPGEFDDYIAAPKDNFYQSLHTSVLFDDGKNLEIQIRTPDMNSHAELGIAAHWRYKEGTSRDEIYEQQILSLRAMMDWRQDVVDAREFVDSMKTDVFEDRVYVFTPRGDIQDLPAGSTPIDFAYQVHTEIGHRCRGAKVNGKLTSLDYQLRTGDKVEIITLKRGGPSRDWLNPNLGLVKTTRARQKIKQWFRYQAREENINLGRALLEKELRRLGMSSVNLDRLAREFDYRNIEELYIALGTGDLSITRIIKHLTLPDKEGQEVEQQLIARASQVSEAGMQGGVAVVGLKGLLTTMARCCNPAPGDEIVGYITRGRGATIHRQDCPNILSIADRERLVKVTWGEPKSTYPVPVRVCAYDRNGLMKDVSTLISDEGINMSSVKVDTHENLAVFELILEVRDIIQLSRVLDRLEKLSNVTEALRVPPG